MPITGPSSYLPTTQEFLTHWQEVNDALPALKPLALDGGGVRADFQTQRDALLVGRDDLESADLEAVLARGALQLAKVPLLAKLNLFTALVRGSMKSSVYFLAVPLVPGIGDGQEVFSKPMTQAVKLWFKINGSPPPHVTAPVVLADDTTLADFEGAVEALGGLYDAVVDKEQDFSLVLGRRNAIQDGLYEMMKAYRVAVPTRLLPGNPLLESLPALSPTGGRTPDPVELSGVWNAGDGAAHLTGTVSNDPDLVDYELRWCAGANYSTVTEHVVGSVPGGSPPVFVTTKGLGTSGAVASFRLYVRIAGGGEAGSDTVVVERT